VEHKYFVGKTLLVTIILLHWNGLFLRRIIIGSDRRPETKQGIEGKIYRFRSGRVKVRVRDRVRVRYN